MSRDHAKERQGMTKRNTVKICGLHTRGRVNSWSNRQVQLQHIGPSQKRDATR